MNQTDEKKVAIMLADGCEEIEALTVVDLLTRAGIPRTTVTINKEREVVSSHHVPILADALIDDTDLSGYDMIVLPGGIPGAPNLAANARLREALKAFAAQGKMIAAICAAPAILADLGLLAGKNATCNPSVEHSLIDGGAILSGRPVTVDGSIITSQAMGTAIPFGLAIVEHYLGRAAAEDLRARILYDCAGEH
jgi:4-methyl-5(b-hydroxyethyl)-thiazole monophosphate biosynthesis